MKKNLALFDFDGTITYNDSFLEVIKFQKGKWAFYKGFLFMAPIMVLFKLKVIPNWKAKEMVITYFFKGDTYQDFQKKCDDFAETIIPKMLRPKANKKIEEHKKRGDRVVLVSASAENWLQPWTKKMDIELIGTQLETKDGLLTGKLCSPNCYGPEKLKRVLDILDLKEFENIYVYGDSRGDKEILAIATEAYYRHF
ncbi:MAG TPA: HAD-IB family hydrolase [Cytophagales bacterium]|nr:HAD-IB family hydrolase [Cytophagales bacterium]